MLALWSGVSPLVVRMPDMSRIETTQAYPAGFLDRGQHRYRLKMNSGILGIGLYVCRRFYRCEGRHEMTAQRKLDRKYRVGVTQGLLDCLTWGV